MKLYHINIEVKLSVPAYNRDEAKEICLELFRQGKYNHDGIVTLCEEVKR